MVHRAANGWIVPLPEALGFSIPVHRPTRIIEGREHHPTGVFIHGSQRVYLNYAGVDGCYWEFDLPNDPEFLRDLADGLRKVAREIDERRGNSN